MVTPMERAVPATISMAASMSLALRSGIYLGYLGELLLGELTNLVGLGLSGTRLEVQPFLMR